MQSQTRRIEVEQIELVTLDSNNIGLERPQNAMGRPDELEQDKIADDDAETSSGDGVSSAGRPTKAELAAKHRARARLACDLLLARLYRYHPDHAMAHLKGIKPRVVDLEPPSGQGFTVVSEPGHSEARELTAEELHGVPDISLILHKVASFYNVSMPDICSERNTFNIFKPRRIAAYLARAMTGSSLKVIGKRIGGRDHSTVHHAITKVEKMIAKDAGVRAEIDAIIAQIRTLYPHAQCR